jgi:hypothetical protein
MTNNITNSTTNQSTPARRGVATHAPGVCTRCASHGIALENASAANCQV